LLVHLCNKKKRPEWYQIMEIVIAFSDIIKVMETFVSYSSSPFKLCNTTHLIILACWLLLMIDGGVTEWERTFPSCFACSYRTFF
jgi:hypothetical protein